MVGENSRTLYIGNLHTDTTDSALRDFFASHGEIESVDLSRHNKTDEFQRFAWVVCKSRDDAEKLRSAVHGKLFMERPLWCDWSRPTPERWEAWLDPDTAPTYE